MKMNKSSYIAISIAGVLVGIIFLYDRAVAYKELVQIGRINVETSNLSLLQKQTSLKNIEQVAKLIRIEEIGAIVVILVGILIIIRLFIRKQPKQTST